MIKDRLAYQLKIARELDEKDLQKGVFISVIHATRIPPHIGIIAGSVYHSLSIKGQDINVPAEALVKNSRLRKIVSLFIRLKPHGTFSDEYISEHFITNVQQFKRVDKEVATCLSPIKLLFEEVYGISMKDINYLYELLPILDSKGMIEEVMSLYAPAGYQLPVYTKGEIDAGIDRVREEYKN